MSNKLAIDRTVQAACIVCAFLSVVLLVSASRHVSADVGIHLTARDGTPDAAEYEALETPEKLLSEANSRGSRVNGCEAAIGIYLTIVQRYPDSNEAGEATLRLGACFHRMERLPEARVLLETFLKRAKGQDLERALILLSKVHRETGELREAQRCLRRLVAESSEGSRWRVVAETLLKDIESEIQGANAGGQLSKVLGSIRVSAVTLGIRFLSLIVCIGLAFAVARLVAHPPPYILLTRGWSPRKLIAVLLSLWLLTACWNVLTDWLALVLVSNGHLDVLASLGLLRYRGICVAVVAITVVTWGEGLGPFRLSRRSLFPATVLIVAIAIALLAVWTLLADAIGSQEAVVAGATTPTGGLSIGFAAYLAFIAVAEECVYRGAAYQVFRNMAGRSAGICLSAALFASSHAYGVLNTLYAFVFGLVSAWLVEKYRSLLVPIVLHWLMDIVAHAL